MRLLILGALLMGAYFSDLQEDGRKRWYNVVADRYWELQQVAKLYRVPIITRGGISHIEVPVLRRQEMSYLEGNTSKHVSGYSTVARDARRTSQGSDYFFARRVGDIERVRRDTSIGTTGSRTATRISEASSGGTTGSRETKKIGRIRYINFDPQGGGIQE